MTFPRRLPALLPLLLALALVACGEDDEGGAAGGEPALRVVATTTHVADFVRSVGGDRVDVESLIPPGADAHDHEVRPDDVRAVADADLVFRSGGDLDEWLDEAVRNAGTDAPVVDLIRSVRTRAGGHAHAAGEEEHAGEEIDPHWWQDPRNVERAVRAIRERLARADAAGAAVYGDNAAAYLRRVRALDRAVARCLADVPASRRRLVTTHDAYGYYADRYDIEVLGTVIPSLSSQGQPSAGETAELVETIRRAGVRTIFAESAVNSKVEAAIARSAGARVGPALWADTLGRPGSSGGSWLEAFASDSRALIAGFTDGRASCSLPT
jgi:ABC-type Zn uptake system ZnuABC Zn-binding protein ZnuA